MISLLRFLYTIARKYYDSVNYAIEGILTAARTQSHVRFHLFSTCILLLFCYTIGVNKIEFICLTALASLVVVSEMLNSAIEVTVDIASPDRSELARIAKDMAAGAVLISAGFAAIIGFFIIYPHLGPLLSGELKIAKHGPIDLLIASLIIVLTMVIIIKAYFGKGHPLRGGLPSGHTALAFSLWVNLLHLVRDFRIHILFFVIAVIIALSRLIRKIHTPVEVVAGIVIGTAVTYFLYMVYS